jgi:hypothetical protein
VVTVRAVERAHDSVPIAKATTGLPVLDPPAQSPVRLFGQVLQEQSVHRPLEADVQVRDVAFGERDDVDAGEGETLEEACGVFLIATEAF